MDDFESPEVQKDFPGLYTPGVGKGKKEDPEFLADSTKKDKKKDKKDKDKGYATLAGGDSSPDEEDTKSPSKSTKRIKAFKFPLKKEKREKSRDKDQTPSCSSSNKKEKKEKKVKPTQPNPDEPQDLGDAQPIFGVPLSLAVERSRCHDTEYPLPLVVRDCIDYLQEFGIKSEGVYKAEPAPKEAKLQHLKKLYNNRESNGWQDLDVATAAALLKVYLRDLPEPLLTAALISQFEEMSANSNVQEQEAELKDLVAQLPAENQVLLKWIALHLDAVSENNPTTNAQSLAMIFSPILQTSHRLFVTILCHCRSLFLPLEAAAAPLPRYIPPLSGANPVLPESREGIVQELGKQESLLSQIHSEMNSGFVTKRREEQLWEVQRIITQLKRKLRQEERKGENMVQKSVEDAVDSLVIDSQPAKSSDENSNGGGAEAATPTEKGIVLNITDTGFLALPTGHPEAAQFMQDQLENYELHRLRHKLQSAINQERAEIHSLKKQLVERISHGHHSPEQPPSEHSAGEVQELLAQNAYLESVRRMLCEEILAENKRIVDLRVQLCAGGI